MNKKLEQKILDMKDEIIKGIMQNVAIESVKSNYSQDAPYGKNVKLALIDALEQSSSLGLKSVNVDNKVGYTEIGAGDEMVAILGHLDIVPLGEGWTYNPLGEIVGDKLYGRGVADDKGPTISAIYALKAIKDLGIKLDRRIRVIYGTDEESGSDCVKHYVETGQELPVAGFTPDADYPVVFAEKGMLGFNLSKHIRPSDDFEIIELFGGVAKNVVTHSVTMVYKTQNNILGNSQDLGNGTYKIVVNGKSAHASTPEKGENAFMLLCKIISDKKVGGDIAEFADFVSQKFNFEPNGQSLGVFYEDEESGKITLSIGIIGFDNGKISFTLDIRFPVSMDAKLCIAKIEEVAKSYEIKTELTNYTKPHYVPKNSILIETLMDVYREKTGDNSEPIAMGGGTYAKAFKNMVAYGIEFPGRPLLIHQPDECILIDDIIKSTQISAEAIVRLANAKF